MNALVIYDSQYGNTEQVAQAIAEALRESGQVRTVRSESVHSVDLQDVDMLVVGCPTQGWKPTLAMLSFLEGMPSERLHGVGVACFDTRFHMPRWMTGSAAKVTARKLQQRGATLLVPPESFFVKGGEGPLHSGELERAATWARMLAQAVEAAQPVAPGT